MNTLKAISLAELIEKTDAVGLTDAENSEKRSLQRRLAGRQGRQDAKAFNSLLKNQMAWVRKAPFFPFYGFLVSQTNDFGPCAGAFQKTAKESSPNHSEKPPKNGRWRY